MISVADLPRRFAPAGPWLAAGATALGWWLCFPPAGWAELGWFFLIPGLVWCAAAPEWKRFLRVMAVAHTLAWGGLLVWLRHAVMIGFAGWPEWLSGSFGVGLAFLLGAVVAGFAVAWWALARWTVPRLIDAGFLSRLGLVLGLAGAWALLEWVRTWFLSGFPWATLATSQWQRPVALQVVAITGQWGLSFALVAANVAIFSYGFRVARHFRGGWRRVCPEFYLVIFVLIGGGIALFRESLPRTPVPVGRVALVQPDIPQDEKWDPARAQQILGVLETETRRAKGLRPDLVIWPEAVLPYPLLHDEGTRRWTEAAARFMAAPVVLGSVIIEGKWETGRWYNGAFAVDPGQGVLVPDYRKRKLVPFGEYVPGREWFPWLGKLVPIGGDFQRGTSAAPLETMVAGRPLRLGVLVCYEDIFPGLTRASVAAGAEVLVVLTNNNWFGREAAAYQHAAHSVLRAVETRRPVLRCGNAGWSGWISEHGDIRAVLTDEGGSIYFRGSTAVELTRDARWIGRESPYVRHGDWFVAVAAAWVALLAVAAAWHRRRPAAPPVE